MANGKLFFPFAFPIGWYLFIPFMREKNWMEFDFTDVGFLNLRFKDDQGLRVGGFY